MTPRRSWLLRLVDKHGLRLRTAADDAQLAELDRAHRIFDAAGLPPGPLDQRASFMAEALRHAVELNRRIDEPSPAQRVLGRYLGLMLGGENIEIPPFLPERHRPANDVLGVEVA